MREYLRAGVGIVLLVSAAVTAPAGEPEWKQAVRRKLDRKVSFEFAETPLTEAIAFIQILTKVSMIIDPVSAEAKGSTPVTLKVTNESLEEAFRRLLEIGGLEYTLRDGAIWVATRERIAALAEADRAARNDVRQRKVLTEWERALRQTLDREVTFEFVDTPLGEAVQFFQTLTETTIIMDPRAKAGDKPITLKAKRQTLAAALKWTLKLADLDYALANGAVFISTPKRLAEVRRRFADRRKREAAEPRDDEPEWKREVRRKLDRRISFEFAETPFTEAVAFLQTLTKVNMIIASKAAEQRGSTPVTLKVTNMPLGRAFDWILVLCELDHTYMDSAIFITTREKIDALARYERARRLADVVRGVRVEWERDIRTKLARKVTFEFVDTPISEAMLFLQTLTETTFVLDPTAFEDPEGKDGATRAVTLKVTKMPLRVALRWICRNAGFDYALLDEAVFVSTPKRLALAILRSSDRRVREVAEPRDDEPEWKRELRRKLGRKISFEVAETPLAETVAFLQTLTKTRIVLPEMAEVRGKAPITLKVSDMTFDVALRWLFRPVGLDYELKDGAVLVARRWEPEWRRELQRRLGRKVTFDFVDTPLSKLLLFLEALTGTTIVVDRAVAAKPITLKVRDMSVARVFELHRLAGLDNVLLDEAIFVAESGRVVEVLWHEVARRAMAQPPGDGDARHEEFRRRLGSKVSFELAGTPLATARSFLQQLAKVDITIDPAAVKAGLDTRTPVTLKVQDMRLENAIKWFARAAGLTCSFRKGVVWISTPERIRSAGR